MIDWYNSFTFLLAIMALAIKPGPGMLAVASRAIQPGFPAVLAFLIGTNACKIMFFFIAGFGIATAAIFFNAIADTMKICVSLYLLWLGTQSLFYNQSSALSIKPVQACDFKANIVAGFMLTISNPFDIAFFAGLLPTLVDVELLQVSDFVIGSILIVLGDTFVTFSYTLPLALTRKRFEHRQLTQLNRIAGLVMFLASMMILSRVFF